MLVIGLPVLNALALRLAPVLPPQVALALRLAPVFPPQVALALRLAPVFPLPVVLWLPKVVLALRLAPVVRLSVALWFRSTGPLRFPVHLITIYPSGHPLILNGVLFGKHQTKRRWFD